CARAARHRDRRRNPGDRGAGGGAMNRTRHLRAVATVAITTLLALAARVHDGRAQGVAATRPVAAGEVTGLELAIEGDVRAPRGGRVRWLLTAYEVVGLADLRPAPGARVRVLSSLARARAVAEVVADARGRAAVGFDVPADA